MPFNIDMQYERYYHNYNSSFDFFLLLHVIVHSFSF